MEEYLEICKSCKRYIKFHAGNLTDFEWLNAIESNIKDPCKNCSDYQPELSKREDSISPIDIILRDYVIGKIDYDEMKLRCGALSSMETRKNNCNIY